MTTTTERLLAELWAAGDTTSQLAEKFDMDVRNVQKKRKRMGFLTRCSLDGRWHGSRYSAKKAVESMPCP